jgi:S-adenosylmethionine:tRNA ribosyltransferase-isomerase
LNLSDFDYQLPMECVAQFPAEPRDAARLLVHLIGSGQTDLDRVSGLAKHLRAGDLLVLNDTRVLPARVMGRRSTGGSVEFLFVEPGHTGQWRAMVRPARKLRPGEVILAGDGAMEVTMVERLKGHDGGGSPLWEVQVASKTGGAQGVEELLEAHGRMPLPPYIERESDESDLSRYQTVYAQEDGAVAAPTAGLHFTPELLSELVDVGVQSTTVTLHVGLGTFLPVTEEVIEDHEMHSERFRLTTESAEQVEACRARGGRVIAVGTTSVRVLEACSDGSGRLVPGVGRTDIFIRPGYEFRSVDGLLTNFHLPKSTLLMLVAALAGRETILSLYERAIAEELRFYSYGDAMLLLP